MSQTVNPRVIIDVKNAIKERFGEYKLEYLFFKPVSTPGNGPAWTYFDEAAHRYFIAYDRPNGLFQGDPLSDEQIKTVLNLLIN